MKFKATFITTAILAGVLGTAAISDGHANKATLAAVKARQSQMQLYAFNLGLLGGMAKGAIEYNAEAAAGAASNLAGLSRMDQSRMWPKGSDNGALGDATAALPAIWQDGSTIGDKGKALAEAAGALQLVAADGLVPLQGAMGAVGGACGACHKAYRQSKD